MKKIYNNEIEAYEDLVSAVESIDAKLAGREYKQKVKFYEKRLDAFTELVPSLEGIAENAGSGGGGGGKDVPGGGTAGQVLAKKSDEDNDVEWKTVEGGSGSGSASFEIDPQTDYAAVSDGDHNAIMEILADPTAPVITISKPGTYSKELNLSVKSDLNGKQDAMDSATIAEIEAILYLNN